MSRCRTAASCTTSLIDVLVHYFICLLIEYLIHAHCVDNQKFFQLILVTHYKLFFHLLEYRSWMRVQDLKKQTAMRLMTQQHNSVDNQGPRTQQQSRGYSPNTSKSATSLSPSSSKQHYNYPAHHIHRSGNRKGDRSSPKVYETNDDASTTTSCSAHSLAGVHLAGGFSPRSQHGRPQKLPHGLTVHELKELTAARLAREAAELSTERKDSPRPILGAQQSSSQANAHQVRQPHVVHSRRMQGRSTNTPRNTSVLSPDSLQSPTSFVADRGMHQTPRQPTGFTSSRFDFCIDANKNHDNTQSLFSRQRFECSKTPAEDIPARSRHWSVDSVSSLGSDFFGSERSPFATPYRKANGNGDQRSVDHVFEIGRSSSFLDPTDDFGRALQSQISQSRSPHDAIASPSPSFSERQLRSPYLSSFWPVQEHKPSDEIHAHQKVQLYQTKPDQRDGSYPMSLDSTLSPFDEYKSTRLVSSLSLPATDDDFLIVGQERRRTLQPNPLQQRQHSMAAELPNWVAESVLITPQLEIRKMVSDEKSVRSESAVGSSNIFRPGVKQRVSPSAMMWTTSSSSNGNEARPNSFSFSAFDNLADSLGNSLNLETNQCDSMFHRPLIEPPKSSTAEEYPFTDNEIPSYPTSSDRISRGSSSFWPNKGFGWGK